MDYFNEAFGGFSPQVDEDAALKFSLDVLLADHRVSDLIGLVLPASKIGGVEGEPGWIIERREEGELHGYENWPDDARYRAYVEPESYALAHPEFFCDKSNFFRYVQSIARVYVSRYPENRTTLGELQAIIGEIYV
jgi:hypothetical protein